MMRRAAAVVTRTCSEIDKGERNPIPESHSLRERNGRKCRTPTSFGSGDLERKRRKRATGTRGNFRCDKGPNVYRWRVGCSFSALPFSGIQGESGG